MAHSLVELVFGPPSHDGDGKSHLEHRRPGAPTPAPASEVGIAERIRAGDASAFEALFRDTYPRLVRTASAYVDGEMAADAIADVFAGLWTARADWRPENVDAYLYRAVRNRVLDLLRGVEREARRRDTYQSLGPTVSEAVAFPDEDDRAAAVRAAIAELNPRQRELVILRWQEGRTPAEVAELMETTVRAITSLQDRTLGRLRRRAPEILASLRRSRSEPE